MNIVKMLSKIIYVRHSFNEDTGLSIRQVPTAFQVTHLLRRRSFFLGYTGGVYAQNWYANGKVISSFM
jgi:hypothetical protein